MILELALKVYSKKWEDHGRRKRNNSRFEQKDQME